MHGLTKDETGKTYGRLMVLRQSFMKDGKAVKGIHWLCLCECTRRAVVLGSRLRNGSTKSCGCLVEEQYFKHSRRRYFAQVRETQNRRREKVNNVKRQNG